MQPQIVTRLFDSINQQHSALNAQGVPHVLLTAPKDKSPQLRILITFNFPELTVVSLNEVPNDCPIETVGMIEIKE